MDGHVASLLAMTKAVHCPTTQAPLAPSSQNDTQGKGIHPTARSLARRIPAESPCENFNTMTCPSASDSPISCAYRRTTRAGYLNSNPAMKIFRRALKSRSAVLATALFLAASLRGFAAEPKLVPLFNGKDLTNFKADDSKAFWRVEKGVLIGENDAAKKGNYLWTEKEYKDF